MSKMIQVAVSDLHISRSNVRTDYDPAADQKLPDLVASILSLGGLIQPIAVAKRTKGKGYDVIAGQRRTHALRIIVEKHPQFGTVDAVEITDKALFSEASLAENYARAQMSMPEIYTAFARIRSERPNATLEELGAMFGFDAARAGRVMRLAGLSNKVMTAYRAAALDDAEAQAFAATENQNLQDEVLAALDQQPRYNRGPSAIRRLIGIIQRDDQQRLDFVGRDVYQAAGGGFEDDLFNPGEGRLLNPDLLEQLFQERFEVEKDTYIHRLKRGTKMIVADGAWGLADLKFSWAVQPPQITQYGSTNADYELQIRPNLAPLSDDDKRAVESFDRRIETLNGELEVEGVSDDDPRHDELDRLETARADIERKRIIKLPAKGNVVGVAKLDHSGEFDVQLWFASRKDKGVDTPVGSKSSGAVGATLTPYEEMRKRLGLSKDGAYAMQLTRRDMIREQLTITAAAGASYATDYVVFAQARAILNKKGTAYYMTMGGAAAGIENPKSQDVPSKTAQVAAKITSAPRYHAALEEMAGKRWVTVEDACEGFHLFMAQPDVERQIAAAIVAGFIMLGSTSFYQDGGTPRVHQEMAILLQDDIAAVPWEDTVTLDEAFFSLFGHRQRVDWLKEWGADDEAATAKSATSAALCAEARARLAPTWLPETLVAQVPKPLPVSESTSVDDQTSGTDDGADAGDDD